MNERASSVGRLTPYEMVFGVDGLAEREFPALAEELHRRGLVAERRDQFAGDRVSDLLQRLAPEGSEPAALERHLELLFHSFNFWRAGCPVFAFEAAALRDLIARPPELGGWRVRAAQPSLYLELPLNLVWAAVAAEGAPEPLEGVFVHLDPREKSVRTHLLIVLGMRPDRPGFSAAAVDVELERLSDLEEPDAFHSDIPGAELAGLYSLHQSSEALLLVVRALWYLDRYPESARSVTASETAAPELKGHSAPTTLDHHRVRLINRSRG